MLIPGSVCTQWTAAGLPGISVVIGPCHADAGQ